MLTVQLAKTPNELLAEVQRLRTLLPRVRRFTAFGGDNRAALQAMSDVLYLCLDEAAVRRRFTAAGEHVLEAALDAHGWMTGTWPDADGPPSDGWDVLVEG